MSPAQCPYKYVVCLFSGGAGIVPGAGAGVVGGTGGIPGVAPGAGGGARVIVTTSHCSLASSTHN